MIMSGHDGLGHFGADLFPVKNAQGRYDHMACGWPRNPRDPMGLAPGLPRPRRPGGHRTLRDVPGGRGVVRGAAVHRAGHPGEEAQPGTPAAGGDAIWKTGAMRSSRIGSSLRGMPGPEEDAKLLDLAGEVAQEIEKSGK